MSDGLFGHLLHDVLAAVAARRAESGPVDARAFSDPRAVLPILLEQEVISFDLFETVARRSFPLAAIERRVSDFADRYLIGDDGPLPRGLILRARGRLMQIVQQNAIQVSAGQRDEVRLADVLDAALAPYLGDAAARSLAVGALIAEEVAAEIACLKVDPRMVEVIRALRLQGRRILLVSDMYLDADAIGEILQALGIADLFDHVFVSATTGLTKRGGGMFALIDQRLGLSGRARLHLGDNLQSDVQAARKAGWSALHFHDRAADRRRRASDRVAAHPRAAPVAGGRALRKAFPMQRLEPLVAAAFAGFVRRTVSRAVTGRFDKVLFLARDATGFRQGVERFIAERPGGAAIGCPPLGELALNRRSGAWLLYPGRRHPDWQGFLSSQVGFLNRTPLSIRTIMRTFAILPDDLVDLSDAGRSEVAGYLTGDDPATDLGFDRLLGREDLLEALDGALLAKRARIMAYLEEAGLFDPAARLLLVDIGYSGTALKSVSEHFWQRERAGLSAGARLELMLFAANRFHRGNLAQMHPCIDMQPGTFITTDQARHRAAAVNFSWLEPFAADATRGELQDYRPDAEGRMQPVFAPFPGGGDEARFPSERMIEAGRAYEKAEAATGLSEADAERMITACLVRAVTRPGRADVVAMAALSHQGGMGEVRLQDVIHPIRPLRLAPDILACIGRDCWLQGSLKAAGLGIVNPVANAVIALEAE